MTDQHQRGVRGPFRTAPSIVGIDGGIRTVVIGTLIIVFSFANALFASENIRVSIADDRRTVVLSAPSGLVVDGRESTPLTTRMTIRSDAFGNAPRHVRSLKGVVEVAGKPYRGVMEVRKKRNGLLQVVNELDIEEYLKGVVAAEIPSDWEMEVLKAQAVASRTYALYQKRSRARQAYHIRDTVESQVYLGARGERRRALKAVAETKGEVVLYDGEVIAAFYHSSCGGRTEDASVLWGIDEPYLKGVDCDCQQISTYGLWEKRFTVAAVLSALRREGYRVGPIESIESGTITPGGRVQDVLFRTSRGATAVPAEMVRAALGYARVPSIFFEPELIESEVVFSGRGLGHGVGLCQWGARERAQRGLDYRRILQYYYPGTTVGRLP